MPIAGITDGYGPVAGAAERDYSEVSKIDFMTLLVAQIQNQDPMSPMDNQEFTSQITQFTMLEESEKTNSLLEESLVLGQAINNTSMLGLVGKNVTVEGDTASITEGVVSQNMFVSELPGRGTVEITDSNGNVVATQEVSIRAGLNEFNWDGLLEDDEMAPDGNYTVSVTAETASGDEFPVTTLMTGPVDGLRYDNNQAIVMVDDLEYYVSEIYKVS
ncbi:MAG: flagellar hook capping FlgD N-terminal domain-containing protein [Candidatus Krumholzibacteria bacterium]|nr:flagellar hook capping FlgD N-terminal domain-containing protein [Candidatus Krumholzibacteria bacterium]